MSTKVLYLIVSSVFAFHGARAPATEHHELIHRCIDYLATTTRPHGRVRVLELGAWMREKPELDDRSHAILMMEQKTSHNYIVLLKPLALPILTESKRKVIHVSPHELVLIELSENQRATFLEESVNAGTVGITVPQRRPEDLEYGPIFPGTLIDIDGRSFVVVQASSESNYIAGEAVQRRASYMLAELPGRPEKGMVGTRTHILKIAIDKTFELDGTRGRTLEHIGQATVVATMLINALDGPQLKAELVDVSRDRLDKLANARELLIKGYRPLASSGE